MGYIYLGAGGFSAGQECGWLGTIDYGSAINKVEMRTGIVHGCGFWFVGVISGREYLGLGFLDVL